MMKRQGPAPLAKMLEDCKELCLREDVKHFFFVMPLGMIRERMDRAYAFSQSGGVGVICAVQLRVLTYAKPYEHKIHFVNQEDKVHVHVLGLSCRVYVFDECTDEHKARWLEESKKYGWQK